MGYIHLWQDVDPWILEQLSRNGKWIVFSFGELVYLIKILTKPAEFKPSLYFPQCWLIDWLHGRTNLRYLKELEEKMGPLTSGFYYRMDL